MIENKTSLKEISPLGKLVQRNKEHMLVNNGITANRINTCKINDIVWIYNTLFKGV